MVDNSFSVINASGNLLESALLIRRSLIGDGASVDDARRMLSDIHLTMEILQGALSDLESISSAFVGSRQLPKAKIGQATQDVNELVSGLKLASSAAFASSRALCHDLDYGIPDSPQSVENPGKPSTTTSQKVTAGK